MLTYFSHPSQPGAVGTILPFHEAKRIAGLAIYDSRRSEGYVLVSWNTGSNIKNATWIKAEELTPIDNAPGYPTKTTGRIRRP